MKTTAIKPSFVASAFAVSGLLAGCSGDPSMISNPTFPQAPRIVAPATVSLDQDTTATVTIRVIDSDTPAAQLSVTAVSGDGALLPAGKIAVAGSGEERTVSLTPAADATGSGVITLTVTDPSGLTGTARLEARVNPVYVSFRNLAVDAFNVPLEGAAGRVSGVTVQADSDDDPSAFEALLATGGF
jgi:hypothetical protein